MLKLVIPACIEKIMQQVKSLAKIQNNQPRSWKSGQLNEVKQTFDEFRFGLGQLDEMGVTDFKH